MLNQIVNRHLFRNVSRQKVTNIKMSVRMSSSNLIRYAKTHEYARIDEKKKFSKIGISKYAVDNLGDIVYVELPEVGDAFDINDNVSAVESVKAASEIYTPLSGTVTENNEQLSEEFAIVNKDAEKEGWLFKIEMSNVSEFDDMMTKEDYDKFCKTIKDD